MIAELARGLWRWTARHPDWHPRTAFGAEVAAWLVHEGGGTVLVDPILPEGDGELLAALDELMCGEVAVVVTIPYHVREAALAASRWGGTVLGHAAVQRRLPAGTPFRAVAPGEVLPLGLAVHRIGSPRRQEQPVGLAGARALAFGDAVVGVDGGLRVWVQEPLDERRERWYRGRLVPSLEPLLEVDFDRVLVTHGEPVLAGGREALAAALAAPAWYHRPS